MFLTEAQTLVPGLLMGGWGRPWAWRPLRRAQGPKSPGPPQETTAVD